MRLQAEILETPVRFVPPRAGSRVPLRPWPPVAGPEVRPGVAWNDAGALRASAMGNLFDAAGPRVQGELASGQSLNIGENILSPNGQFTLAMQRDGNLVLSNRGRVAWASGTQGQGATSLAMNPDGNLVLYTAQHRPVWSSGTDGRSGARLLVQNDGNAVLYQANNPVWSIRDRNAKGIWSTISDAVDAVADNAIVKKVASAALAPARLIALPATAALAAAQGKNVVDFAGRELGRAKEGYVSQAEFVRDWGAQIPVIGQGVAAATGAGLALAQGKPISQAFIDGVAATMPGGPAGQAAFRAGMTLIGSVAQGKRWDRALLESARSALPSDEARKAFDAGIAVAEGKRLQDIALQNLDTIASALPSSVRDAAKKIMQNPALKSVSNVADVARSLGVPADVVTQAMGAVQKATQGASLQSIASDAARQNLGAFASAAAKGVAATLPQVQKASALAQNMGQSAMKAIELGQAAANNPVGLAIAQLPTAAQSVAQTILADPKLRGFPAAELARRLGVAPSVAQQAIGAVTAGVRAIGGGSFLAPPRAMIANLADQVRPHTSLDGALASLASRVAPKALSPSPQLSPAALAQMAPSPMVTAPAYDPAAQQEAIAAADEAESQAAQTALADSAPTATPLSDRDPPDAFADSQGFRNVQARRYGEAMGLAMQNCGALPATLSAGAQKGVQAMRQASQQNPALFDTFKSVWTHEGSNVLGAFNQAKEKARLASLYPDYAQLFDMAYKAWWPFVPANVKAMMAKAPLKPLPKATFTGLGVSPSLNFDGIKPLGPGAKFYAGASPTFAPPALPVNDTENAAVRGMMMAQNRLMGAQGPDDFSGQSFLFAQANGMRRGRPRDGLAAARGPAHSIPNTLRLRGPFFSRVLASGYDAGAAPGGIDTREVADAQSKLRDLGYPITVDGQWGPKTAGAVKDFQSKNGLVADGIYGQSTKMKLASVWNTRAASAGVPIGPPKPPNMPIVATPGQADPTIRDIQTKLSDLGFGPLERDGLMGPATKSAVMKFQKAVGITADGIPGPVTRTKLEQAWLGKTTTKAPTAPGAPPSAPLPPAGAPSFPPAVISPTNPQMPDAPRQVPPPLTAPVGAPTISVAPPVPMPSASPPQVTVLPSGAIITPQPTAPTPSPTMPTAPTGDSFPASASPLPPLPGLQPTSNGRASGKQPTVTAPGFFSGNTVPIAVGAVAVVGLLAFGMKKGRRR